MRFNDKELIYFSKDNVANIEGVLHHMKPSNNDWYQQSSFKERYFRLVSNCLFYHKINDPEPSGVFVLENVQISYEPKVLPFAFSISFKLNNKFKENEGKHIFSCRCESDVNKWVSILKTSSYEYWRSQYHILQAKISMKTGRDPVLDYIKHQNLYSVAKGKNKIALTKKATFHSHVELMNEEKNIHENKNANVFKNYDKSFSSVTNQVQTNITNTVENLIDL